MVMNYMERAFSLVFSLLILFFSQSVSWAQKIPVNSSNHRYAGVRIAYLRSSLSDCSFQYSPVDFCDEKHVNEIKSALSNMRPNFNQNFIVITPTEWKADHMQSVLAIDVRTGIAYPLPIDGYSGFLREKSKSKKNGKIQFSLSDNRLCITGGILVYRAFEEGTFCFKFENDKFVGHHTEYMHSN
jgi:hypothetical protein